MAARKRKDKKAENPFGAGAIVAVTYPKYGLVERRGRVTKWTTHPELGAVAQVDVTPDGPWFAWYLVPAAALGVYEPPPARSEPPEPARKVYRSTL